MENKNVNIAMKVSRNTIIGNVLLFAFKLVGGIIGHSAAMLSDAVHTLSDVLSTFIVIIGVKVASKKPDKEHLYGHERFESVAAIISIVGKETMYWYTKAAAKKINSGALMADAWHHRSDALSSIGSFIGILGARIGFPVLDAVACLVICILIAKAAIDIFIDAINKMTDRACDDEIVEKIHSLILEQDKVLGIDLLRTRLFGDKIYVDVEIFVDGNMPLFHSHDIAHVVHDVIEKQFENVKHCMVHVNPGTGP